MGPKRNHHILPRLYLKGFVEKKDEPFIWEYRKGMGFNPGAQTKSNPRHKHIGVPCAVKDYYAYPHEGGGVDYDSYEDILETLEKPANPIFEKIRSQKPITAAEKETFASYMGQMLRRVPSYRADLKKRLPEVAKAMEPSQEFFQTLNWPDNEETRKRYKEIAEREANKEGAEVRTHLKCVANTEQSLLPAHFMQMKWRFFTAPRENGFLTGDNPIFYFKKLGLRNPASEVSFPISTEVALVASWAENHKEGFFKAPSQVVKELNRRTASFASELVYFWRSESWVMSLLDKVEHRFNSIH